MRIGPVRFRPAAEQQLVAGGKRRNPLGEGCAAVLFVFPIAVASDMIFL